MAGRPLTSAAGTFGTIVGTAQMSLLDTLTSSIFSSGFNDSSLGWVNYGIDTGTLNNYAVTLPVAPSTYVAGMTLAMLPMTTNTTAATLNVNALGVKPVVDQAGNAVVANAIVANVLCPMIFDGTSFRILTPSDPPGKIIMYGGTALPSVWLACDGSSKATATYPALFAAISYNYGGSGANFNVPNLNNAFAYGTTGTPGTSGGSNLISVANLPAHSHPITDPGHNHGTTETAHSHTYTQVAATGGIGSGAGFGNYGASTSAVKTNLTINNNTIGITTTNNTGSGTAYLPPYQTVQYYIHI